MDPYFDNVSDSVMALRKNKLMAELEGKNKKLADKISEMQEQSIKRRQNFGDARTKYN